jgi:putative endonuclease
MSLLARLAAFFRVETPLGRRGEHAAAEFLKRAGYTIVGMNVRLPAGEIDLVAQAPDGKTIVVVEVKTSAWDGKTATPPEVHVNRAKERKLADLASQLVKRNNWGDRPVRFDVVGVVLAPGRPPVVRHHPAAFESYF